MNHSLFSQLNAISVTLNTTLYFDNLLLSLKYYTLFTDTSLWKNNSSSCTKFSRFENSAQAHSSSTDSIELGHGKEQEVDTQQNEVSSNEVTHRSVISQIKLTTEPIFWQVEKLCVLLEGRNELKILKLPVHDVMVRPQSQCDNVLP